MVTKIRLQIQRQANQDGQSYSEEFEIPYREKLNVISALIEIQKNPVTVDGKTVQPPTWEAACLEEVCGSCTMNINGVVRQACSALVDRVGDVRGDTIHLTLEPMKKFPIVRDLIVDRSKMFEDLKKLK